ncbi:MAG: hypothetical protein ACLQSX_07640 [Smithella sp.]
MHNLTLLAASELAWIEVKLARVPHFLFSINLINFIVNNLKQDEEGQKKYWDFLQHIDAVFSMVLLRSNLAQLETLKKIPHLLNQLNLVCSEGSLLFALGHLDKLRADVWFDNKESTEKIEEFYELVCAQPANDDLPLLPELCSGDTIELKSCVLGINLVIYADANQISILIAESLLSALEAFLATSLTGGIMPYKQNVKVAIKIDKDLKEEFGITLISNSANFELEVAHKENFDLKSADAIRNFRDFSTHFIAELLPKIALYNNINDHLRHLAEEENVFSRSLIFSDVMTLSQNVFGGLAWINLSEVSKSIKKAAYKLQRTTQWKPKTKINKVEKQLKMGEGDAPEDIANADNIKHSERRVVSLIDVPLWNNAKWHGTLFMVYQDGVFPPCIGLLFKGEDSARKIFKGWLDQFGKKDENESLRVCIITGIDKKNPTHYRVHIGTNIKAHMGMEERKQLLFVFFIPVKSATCSR